MKKLKKVLSLVLVLAMALSVFGVCASAANVEDYADADEITYSEAVGVLSGLGVLIGDDDGSFHPGNTLLREQAAKIASYLIGLQDQVTQGPTFSDVAEDNWAKGYIAICEANGLIAGNGDGTFAPEGTLTGYEWEKIVICALGYDAAKTNMLGDSWQGGVAALANELDLLDGLNEDYDAGRAITREEAAQIAFNALSRGTVKYSYSDSLLGTPTGVTLGEKIFHLSVKNTFDVFGAPVAKVYYNNKTNKEYASFAYSAVASYDNEAKGVKAAKIEADLEDAGVKNPTVEYYVDGVTGTVTGGRGVGVSVYKYTDLETGKDVYRAVEINTYVEVLSKAAYTAEVKNTNGTVTAAAYYTLDQGTAKTNKNVYLPAEGFKDEDIVVYNVGNEENLGKAAKTVAVNAEAKTLVGGTATTVSYNGTAADARAKDGYVAFDKGDNLYYSKKFVYGTITGAVRVNGYYGVVYDAYGNIIYITEAKRETISSAGHLYVIDAISYAAENFENNTENLYQPITNPEAVAQALVVLYTDDTASVEVVDIALGQLADGTFAQVDKYGYVDPQKPITVTNGVDVHFLSGSDGLVGKFVEYYTTADGEYVLTACEDAKTSVTTAKDSKYITVDPYDSGKSADVIASSNTKLTYITFEADPYTAVTSGNIYDLAKSIKVTASTATGFTSFVTFNPSKAGYLTVKGGYATVGATIGGKSTANTYVYAMFTGIKETTNPAGEVYTFVGSDGEPIEKTAVASKQDDNNVDTQTGGSTGVFNSAVYGEVYKLAINSEGNIVGYSKLNAVSKGEAEYVDAAYLKVKDAAQNAVGFSEDFASVFGGYAYNEFTKTALAVTSLVTPAESEYVATYTDKFTVGGDQVSKIVFVKYGTKVETVDLEAKLVLESNTYKFELTSNNKADDVAVAKKNGGHRETFNQNNKTLYSTVKGGVVDAEGNAITEGTKSLYLDDLFTVTVVKTTHVDQDATYALSAKAYDTRYTKDITVQAVKADNDAKTSWTLTVNDTPSNADGKYTEYTVAGDVPYKVSRQFYQNNLTGGEKLTLTISKVDGVETVINVVATPSAE
jgi:hypothetical protein